jgi:hypothetical protein
MKLTDVSTEESQGVVGEVFDALYDPIYVVGSRGEKEVLE